MTDYSEEQRNELEALESIYPDSFTGEPRGGGVREQREAPPGYSRPPHRAGPGAFGRLLAVSCAAWMLFSIFSRRANRALLELLAECVWAGAAAGQHPAWAPLRRPGPGWGWGRGALGRDLSKGAVLGGAWGIGLCGGQFSFLVTASHSREAQRGLGCLEVLVLL